MHDDPVTDTPASLLARRAATAGDRVAFVEGATGRSRTWADLAAVADGWCALAGHDGAVAPGTRLGLLSADPLEAAGGFIGALAAGVLVAPLDPGARPDELAGAAGRLGLTAVVADDGAADLAEALAARTGVGLLDAGRRGLRTRRAPRPGVGLPASGPAAMLMASSGTTGDPKLIPLRADALVRTATAVVAAHRLGADDVGYSPLPLFHINGLVVGVLSTLVSGGRLVVDRRFSASRFWSVVDEQQVTWVNLVPAIIGILAREAVAVAPTDTARVRFARSASAPLSHAAREAFEARTGIGVVETYGMTEAASQICANPLDEAGRRPGSVGLPTDVEVRVDADGPGATGEVLLRGARVTDEYWTPGTAEARPATDADGWLATGDLGWLDEDGYLTLVGRVDDVINRGGEKIFPREVEEVLLADPDVVAAGVVGRDDQLLGSVPVAYVTVVPGAASTPDARRAVADRLSALAAARLGRAKRPAEVLVVDELPVGATGKVKHAAIRRAQASSARPPEPDPDPAGVLAMPERTAKPRTSGLTMVIDGGQPTGVFVDAVRSFAPLVDLVKFGWGTALVTPDIDAKLAVLRELGIRYYFGGTLFEKFTTQDHFDAFLDFAAAKGADTVEISNGTIPLSNTGKAAYIRKAADRFTVVSEVGFKDSDRSGRLLPSQWVDAIFEDLDAGASLVITEARESGSSGICRPNGELRGDLVEEILHAGVPADRLLWEAPTKALQTHFVTRLGANVNLGNIAVDQVVGLETLRLGLRADTLMHVEQELAERDPWERGDA